MVLERRLAKQIAARQPQSGVAKTKHRSRGLERRHCAYFGPSPLRGDRRRDAAYSTSSRERMVHIVDRQL